MSNQDRIAVRSVMQTTFIIIDGLTTVADALRAMKRENATTVIVDKRDEKDEYGLVLLSDVAKEVIAKDMSIERVNVYEIMAKPVIHVHPDMDIRYCARLFESFGLSVAPVIEEGKVIGIVNYGRMVLKGLADIV